MIPYLHLGPLTIGTFGLMMWLAFVAAYLVMERDFLRRSIAADATIVIAVSALSGLLGAKLWHVLESPHELRTNTIGVIFSRTGFAWFGGFVAGLLTLIFFARRYHVPVLRFLDACSPAAALGYGVGRIGCLLSGDGDYGVPSNLPWAMSFPNGLVPTTDRVHPTPIYEFLAATLIAIYLWRRGGTWRRSLPRGRVLAEFLMLTGLERFLVEFIRINPRVILGMSNAQAAALVSIVAGALLWATSRSPERFPTATMMRR